MSIRGGASSEKRGIARKVAYWIVDTVERSNRSPDEQAALRELAQDWKNRRQDLGKTRAWTASRLGDVTVDELALFENGMLPLDQLPEDFLGRLGSLLGQLQSR